MGSLLSRMRQSREERSGHTAAQLAAMPHNPDVKENPAVTDAAHRPVHMRHEMLAGSMASVVSRFCVAPLDVLKIRFQIQEQPGSHHRQYTSVLQAFGSIYKAEGLRAFWKGNAAAELMVVPYGAVSFLAYSSCKSWFPLVAHPDSPFASYQHLSSLVAGSFAGLCATISTYPLDLLRTRFAAQQQHRVYCGLWHAASHIVEREGLGGLYTGITPTLIGIVPLMALQFGCYEAFKQAIRNAKAEPGVDPNSLPLTFMEQSLAGFSAGVISKFLTMPLDVIKKRFQVSGFEIPHHPHGVAPLAEALAAAATVPPGTVTAEVATASAIPREVAKAAASAPTTIYSSLSAADVHRKPEVPVVPPPPCATPALSHYAPPAHSGATGDTPLHRAPHSAHVSRHIPTAHANSLTPPSAPSKQGPLTLAPVGPPVPPTTHAAGTAAPHPLPAAPHKPQGPRRRRRHDQPVSGRRPFTGVLDCARGIIAHEGVAGLFEGSVPSILKAGPNSAIIYMVYEYTIRWLNGDNTQQQAKDAKADAHKFKE